jgi:hypothetical protein
VYVSSFYFVFFFLSRRGEYKKREKEYSVVDPAFMLEKPHTRISFCREIKMIF